MNLRTECVTKVQRREYRSKYFHRKFSILENFSAFHILKINQNSKFNTYISMYYKYMKLTKVTKPRNQFTQ